MSLRCILLLLAVFAAGHSPLAAQLLTASPVFPTAGGPVTITFDASQGNGGLANCNCAVYVHTGVITSASTSPSDWKYVVTTWGQANAAWLMTPVPGQPNKYTFTIGPGIRQYYNVPAAEQILRLAFVFRNANGTLEGKGVGNSDIFYDVFPENAPLSTVFTSPAETNLSRFVGQNIQVLGAASRPSTISLYEDGQLISSSNNASSINHTLTVLQQGQHLVEMIANDGQSSDTSRFSYEASYRVLFSQPTQSVVLTTVGSSLPLQANAHIPSTLQLLIDGQPQGAAIESSATYSNSLAITTPGTRLVQLAAAYEDLRDTASFVYVVPGSLNIANPPAGFNDGISYLPDGRVYLQLYAPGKQVIFVLGDFNNWTPRPAYQMNRSQDGNTWWLYLEGLQAGQYYGMQYLVDGNLRIADPYSTLVLDRWNDPFISQATWPGLPAYPTGKTDGIVSLLHPGEAAYDWQVEDFTPPAKSKLVIYEMLIRDFVEKHDYLTLIDTLDYLQRLGVNAIELMPVNEFEGNLSWGYNPSFHMALDKYYGKREHLKQFVDACHARGIAVILDVVYNHAFSQSSLAQLYWDAANFRPAPNNPWLNPIARHPFNVGYDFNHESPATRKFVDQVMTYWLTEFKVDGFRFDLSKGFTQRQSSDVNAWNAYDANRIAVLKHYADVVWQANPQAYVILEHFAVNSEETELHAYGNGMLFWGGAGIHGLYLNAARGVNGSFGSASHTSRGWTQPNLIPYMESHDEERLMYANLTQGLSSGSYNIRNFITALRRKELASVFYYTLPGPKMLWQFGELGYDFSINHCPNGTVNNACRTDNKPIRWDYLLNSNRQRLFQVTSSLIALRTGEPAFSTTTFSQSVNTQVKRIALNHPSMNVVALGNFGLTTQNASAPFSFSGWWYEYFTGDSVQVVNTSIPISLQPGEYRLYTSKRLQTPPGGYITATGDLQPAEQLLTVYPNPTAGHFNLAFTLPESAAVSLQVYDAGGQLQQILLNQTLPAGQHQHDYELSLPPGQYYLVLLSGRSIATEKLIIR
jgi:pullulanase/glycogen debranching enzyme